MHNYEFITYLRNLLPTIARMVTVMVMVTAMATVTPEVGLVPPAITSTLA